LHRPANGAYLHTQGDFFTEADRTVHYVRNASTRPARLFFTFVVAKGLTFRISTPAPDCAAALGLK